MYKKWEKIIATKDCSTTRRPNILQQLLHQNYTGTDIRLRHWGISWWSVNVNCTFAHTRVSEGNVPSEKLKIGYF